MRIVLRVYSWTLQIKTAKIVLRKKGGNMKTVKHEIKLERSVKIILGVLAVGILLNLD